MTRDRWFEDLTEKLEGEFDYRLEWLILNLTEDICRLMKSQNINRTQLAEKLNVSAPAVTKILRGNSNFTLRTLLSLSDALGRELKIEFGEKVVDAIVGAPRLELKNVDELYFYGSSRGFGVYGTGAVRETLTSTEGKSSAQGSSSQLVSRAA